MAIDKEYLKVKFVSGDYKSLKDFAEKERISYGYIQQLAAQGKWREEKTKKNAEIAQKLEEKHVEDKTQEFSMRRNDTLALVNKAKRKAEEMLGKVTFAKELNAIVSALYRCNEIENNLLESKSGGAAVRIIDDIKGDGQEYVDDDEETDIE